MRIYLADLFHVYPESLNPDANPFTVPLGIGFLASTIKGRIPGCEVLLFRDPDKLLKVLRTKIPDVVGFSICSWNSDLTRRLSEVVKAISPSVITVGGGPCVDDADDQIIELFDLFPKIDYLVPNEGESGFLSLIQAVIDGCHRATAISGVAYLDKSGLLLRGAYGRPAVPATTPGTERVSPKSVREITPSNVEIPSPYLDCTLDEFLADGLVPIIQTMRGCPYQCHFCVSGATEWNAMRGFDLERVKAEIEYALSRSSTKDLILTDENWGILGERDVEIARVIMNRHMTKGTPNRLYYYTAKIVTPASKEIVEMVAPIAWIGEFSMSFQSLNPETRQAIKRTNISMDKLAANVHWARERGIATSSEMIYGFPYENSHTFFDGVERLVREGVSSVMIFPLQLFPGIDLAAKSNRERFAFHTRFRLTDCAFGIYDDGKLISAESEEIVVANKWSSLEDYFSVRRYAFFQMAILGRGYFLELFRLCSEIGITCESILRKLTLADYSKYPALAAIMSEHRCEAEAELKSSRDHVYQDVIHRIDNGELRGGLKLNLIYLGRLMSSPNALREFLEINLEHFSEMLVQHPKREVVLRYLSDILPNRIVLLDRHAEDHVSFSAHFDYSRWVSRAYGDISELLLLEPAVFEATISDELKRNLTAFESDNRSDLQEIFDKTKSKNLLREIIPLHVAPRMSEAAMHCA